MRITGTRAIAAVLLGLSMTGQALAQETLLARVMESRNRHLWFAVVDGRVRLQWGHLFQMDSNSSSGSVNETFRLRSFDGRLNLAYQRTAKDELLKVSVSGDGDVVSISRTPRGKSTVVPVEFHQVPREKITFSLGDGDRKQTFSADELWQLLIVRRKECEEHLVPLLKILRPDWKLAETAANVEVTLLKDTDIEWHARWATLVEQLGDERPAKREAADRALRAEGPAAIGFLRRLDFERLDTEQRFRVRRILEALAGRDGGDLVKALAGHDDGDSVDKVAARLAGDPAVWLALLGRPEAPTRQIAARQLALLLGGPIDVDAAADPDTQKQQRERLRARIKQQ